MEGLERVERLDGFKGLGAGKRQAWTPIRSHWCGLGMPVAKKDKFHTCGGPRRRPCLGQGRGRRIIVKILFLYYYYYIIIINYISWCSFLLPMLGPAFLSFFWPSWRHPISVASFSPISRPRWIGSYDLLGFADGMGVVLFVFFGLMELLFCWNPTLWNRLSLWIAWHYIYIYIMNSVIYWYSIYLLHCIHTHKILVFHVSNKNVGSISSWRMAPASGWMAPAMVSGIGQRVPSSGQLRADENLRGNAAMWWLIITFPIKAAINWVIPYIDTCGITPCLDKTTFAKKM